MHLFITPLYVTKTNLFHQSWSLYWLKYLPGIPYNLTIWHHNNLTVPPTFLTEQGAEPPISFIQLHICRDRAFTIFPRESVREEWHFNLSVGFPGDCSFLGCTGNTQWIPQWITTVLSRRAYEVQVMHICSKTRECAKHVNI